jgi:hypothetical protein
VVLKEQKGGIKGTQAPRKPLFYAAFRECENFNTYQDVPKRLDAHCRPLAAAAAQNKEQLSFYRPEQAKAT